MNWELKLSWNLKLKYDHLVQLGSKDCRTLQGATPASIRKMAGNGMHLPSAAFCALISMLCLSPKGGKV